MKNQTQSHLNMFVWTMLILLTLVFQGCASSGLPKNHGQSFEAMLFAQAVNPDGPKDRTPVDECPGPVAEAIYGSYLRSLGGTSLAEELGKAMLGSRDD